MHCRFSALFPPEFVDLEPPNYRRGAIRRTPVAFVNDEMERAIGFEPTTSCLAIVNNPSSRDRSEP
jgi:hypothetical protein